MKSPQTARILVAVILVLAALAAIWYVKQMPSGPSSPTPSPAGENPSGLKAYQDSQGRFSFSYPADFARIEAQQPYYGLSKVEIALMSDLASYHPMNYGQDSWLIVSTVANPAACYVAVEGQISFSATRTIDGIEFRQAMSSDAGAGNRYESRFYRTIHNGTCYEIATTLHWASDFTDIDEAAMNRSQDEARAALSNAVESFRFAVN